MSKPFAVGIDAGKTTGVAILEIDTGSYLYFFKSTFWEVIWEDWSKYGLDKDNTVFIIEQPPKGFVYKRHDPRFAVNIAFKSGENNREASLLLEGFKSLGYEAESFRPKTKKWSHKELQKYIELECSTNEHERDAIKLLWEKYLKTDAEKEGFDRSS